GQQCLSESFIDPKTSYGSAVDRCLRCESETEEYAGHDVKGTKAVGTGKPDLSAELQGVPSDGPVESVAIGVERADASLRIALGSNRIRRQIEDREIAIALRRRQQRPSPRKFPRRIKPGACALRP